MEDTKKGLGQDEQSNVMTSPNGFVSGFTANNCGSKSIVDVWYSGKLSLGCDDLEKGMNDSQKIDLGDHRSKSSSACGLVKNKNGGSIAERRAVKCGFNAKKISSLHFRFSSPSSSPSDGSAGVTMSSGISPQMLHDSPILLPNSQLSPTTGTFPLQPLDGSTQMVGSASLVDVKMGNDGSSSTAYNETTLPHLPKVSSTDDLDPTMRTNTDCQSLTSKHSQEEFEYSSLGCKEVGMDIHDANSPPETKIPDDVNSNSSNVDSLKMFHYQSETVKNAEDGYNWRKYGQKQVKGSEYPRSYYRCTHSTCLVKKKVERSPDGRITEIIYKGAHDHPKPQPCQKSASGSLLPFNETSEGGGSDVWRSIQCGDNDVMESSMGIDGLERTSLVSEVPNMLSIDQRKPMDVLESPGTLELSSTLGGYENGEEDVAAQGSFLIEHDNENDPDMKRRKKDGCFSETTLSSRTIREPRVVIKIDTEVDILEDGYRWRKYGQKVVKGNPNPRSYYKCTAPGCNVRKHVERSAESKKFVITTYEGKHNHEVPAARNNNGHPNSSNGSLSAAATNTQTPLSTPINPHLPKPEAHIQDFPLHYDSKMEHNYDFLTPNFLGNLGAGNSWFYPSKFPSSLPNNNPYCPYGSNVHHPAYVSSSIMPAIPDLPLPLPPRFHPPPMVSYCNTEMSCSSIQPLYAAQQQGHVRLLQPKQEPRDDSIFKTESHDQTDTLSGTQPINGKF